MRGFVKYPAAVALAVLCACSEAAYVRQATVVKTGIPAPEQVAALTRHDVAAGYDKAFGALVSLLQARGCFVENADKVSGLVVARQMLPDGSSLLPSIGEVRRMSFLLVPGGERTGLRLTIYIGMQRYANGQTGTYYREEFGMATDPALYKAWFDLLDEAVAR